VVTTREKLNTISFFFYISIFVLLSLIKVALISLSHLDNCKLNANLIAPTHETHTHTQEPHDNYISSTYNKNV